MTPARDGTMLVLRDVEVTAGQRDRLAGERAPGSVQRVALHRDQVIVFEQRVAAPLRTASACVLALTVVRARRWCTSSLPWRSERRHRGRRIVKRPSPAAAGEGLSIVRSTRDGQFAGMDSFCPGWICSSASRSLARRRLSTVVS